MMSQKSNKKKSKFLNSTENDFKNDNSKKLQNSYIHLNFSFCISKQKCKIEYYEKLYSQLKKISKMTLKEFMDLGKSKTGNIKLEINSEIINRQIEINQDYMKFRNQNNIKNKFSATYDFLRHDLYRAYGELHNNILYILELDPEHESRKK